jgi:hypothetical protein
MRIPAEQIPEASRRPVLGTLVDLDVVVGHVLEWLSHEDIIAS